MQPKLILDIYLKNLSFKIAMSWPVGIGSPEVNLFIDLFKNLSIMLLGIFLVCKFQIIILKTTEVVETQTLLGHMYKVKILNNTGLCKSSN